MGFNFFPPKLPSVTDSRYPSLQGYVKIAGLLASIVLLFISLSDGLRAGLSILYGWCSIVTFLYFLFAVLITYLKFSFLEQAAYLLFNMVWSLNLTNIVIFILFIIFEGGSGFWMYVSTTFILVSTIVEYYFNKIVFLRVQYIISLPLILVSNLLVWSKIFIPISVLIGLLFLEIGRFLRTMSFSNDALEVKFI
jgi:hypothetical protein